MGCVQTHIFNRGVPQHVMIPLQDHLPSVGHVADYMLATAILDHDLRLDEIQLNKLLYITNGFVLRERDEPAFHNPIEAWKYGPVIRIVRETYGCWRDSPIDVLDICRTSLTDYAVVVGRRNDLLKIIGGVVAGVVGGVLEKYGRCTAGELVNMTHRDDTPWKKAYRPGYNKVITTESIANFYRHIAWHNAR